MKVMIYGKNIDVTPSLKEYAEEKVGKLEKFFDKDPMEAQVTLEVDKERHIVEITAHVGGLILRGEEETGDMYASIDGVMDKLERQVHKYKTKINRRLREKRQQEQEEYRQKRTQQLMEDEKELMPEEVKTAAEDEEEDGFDPEIVRTKSFPVKPMHVKEAAMQMDLLDHDFFVFTNADTDEVNVVYRRNDGNYGLIEPIYNNNNTR
ncbi:ribosome hibernation-promoting factor, HPF/YfiA family [Halarsenatibacter silvermanii]|uniref:Ribosome hibernation promoting factor n=1 Tax=Halarsenatibacter silvermanii TaxID=321763 RepID=A0A1G9MLQ1_9FIRM|nr:ribosome-associated translation inhibitor RaiA [Halarsenatibacter silvermanii]SDL75216.1 putative sigma-54 modulation protein [Halarsenatibacter silvermanii]